MLTMPVYIEQLDQKLFLFLNNLGNSNWDWFWLFATGKWSWIPLYVLLTYLLLKKIGPKRTIFTLFFIFLLIVFSDQSSNILKRSFERLRPCNLNLEARTIVGCGRYGFPSAHAFSSMILAVFVGLILKPHYKYIFSSLLIWSFFVGVSRIYVGVHYPGDVITGFTLGLVFGFLFFKLYQYLVQRYFLYSSGGLFETLPVLTQEFEDHGNCLLCRRNYLPLTILLSTTFILHLRTEIFPESFILEGTRYEIYYEMLGVTISLLGVFIRILTVGYPSENLVYQTEKNEWIPKSLNMTGIYSLTRHPLYVGNFLLWLGVTIWTGNYWFISSFCLIYWVYYEGVVFAKDELLSKRFGEKYKEWEACTPAFFPNFKNYREPRYPFNWKRVFRQKKNGLFSLFLIFCLFNISGEIAENDMDYNYNLFLIVMTIMTGLSYLILRLLSEKTTLFHDTAPVFEKAKRS